MTGNELIAELGQDLKNVDNFRTQFLRIINYVDRRMYRKILSIDPTRLTSRFTINYVAGTNSYALPADFQKMNGYAQGLYPVDANSNISFSTRLNYFEEPTNRQGYRLNGNNVIFTDPETTPQEYVLIYRPRYVAKTDLSQQLYTPDEFKEEVLEMLQMYYNKFQRRFGEMNINISFLNQLFNEMGVEVRRTPRAYSPYV